MPMVRLRPCRSPVTRSGTAISQVVTVASSGGRQRCTAAEPKKFPESRTAPAITKTAIQRPPRESSSLGTRPAISLDWKIPTVTRTQPTKSSSSLSESRSGTFNCRTVPVRRQTKSITPTVSGVRKNRTTEAIAVFSSISSKAKPPSMKV